MRAATSALLILLMALASSADARPRLHRPTFARTGPRADAQPLRPTLPARAPISATLPALPPSAAIAIPIGPNLGASRAPSRSISYVQDRTGAVCRTTCATERYACLAGPDPAECQTPWTRCVAGCS